jgi:hypothetical protein
MNSQGDLVQEVTPLAAAMKAKKEIGEPYVLCLGEGATLSSGCREMRWAVRNMIGEECPWVLDKVLESLGRPERCGTDQAKFNELLRTLSEDEWYEDLLDEFFTRLDTHSGQERKRRLDVFLGEDFPSYSYKFLALLARQGFFDVILNANYDPLLQLALDCFLPSTDDQGRPMQAYERLISRQDPHFKNEMEQALASPSPRVKAIWLHGHLYERSGIAFTPQEKRAWYRNVKDAIEKLFGQDLLLIGYTDRDADIRLALENAHGDGNVWYVAPQRPSRDLANALRARQHHQSIRADFDTFCHVLFDLALDLTDPTAVPQGDTQRLALLQEKQYILRDYICTLERRQAEDPMAPATLQVQAEALGHELEGIEVWLSNG